MSLNFRHSDRRSLNARLEARPRAFRVIAAILGMFIYRLPPEPAVFHGSQWLRNRMLPECQ